MNREAFKLARDTLRLAVREYGWRRNWGKREIPGTARYRYTYGPGKFEGEHWSIVHFYDVAMNGCGDEPLYNGDTIAADLLDVCDLERAAFGLKNSTNFVALWYHDNGFVSMDELTCNEYDQLRADYAQEESDNE
jgi:hypothetical protein